MPSRPCLQLPAYLRQLRNPLPSRLSAQAKRVPALQVFAAGTLLQLSHPPGHQFAPQRMLIGRIFFVVLFNQEWFRRNQLAMLQALHPSPRRPNRPGPYLRCRDRTTWSHPPRVRFRAKLVTLSLGDSPNV
jgi:hypothetical protein